MSFLIQKATVNNCVKLIYQIRALSSSLFFQSNRVPEEVIPKNILEENVTQSFGKIYDNKPFRMTLEAKKKYAWCCCGQSKSQPLCDGTHKIQSLKINIKPVLFMVEESKEYWLCNCKQTLHRPFCDGTHLKEEIQSAVKK